MDRFGNLSAGRVLELGFDCELHLISESTRPSYISHSRHSVWRRGAQSSGEDPWRRLRTISNPIFVQSGNKKINWYDVSPGDAFQMSRSTLEQEARTDLAQWQVQNQTLHRRLSPPMSERLRGTVSNWCKSSQEIPNMNGLLTDSCRAVFVWGFSGGRFSPLTPTGLALREGLTAALSGERRRIGEGATFTPPQAPEWLSKRTLTR